MKNFFIPFILFTALLYIRADDEEFIELARAVYYTNDRRAAEKKEINHLLNSEFFEEKIYEKYD